MNLKTKLLTLLAIFCVIGSAGMVCAADDGGYAGSNYEDMNGVSGSQYYVNEGNNLEPGNGLPLENQTDYTHVNSTNNATGNSTGNATGNTTHANATQNMTTTGNTTNTTMTHNLQVAGNPILALLAVSGLIGGYAVLKRKN